MNTSPHSPDDKSFIEIDLGKITSKVYKHKFIFLASILLCMSLAYLYIKYTPPTYKARATYLIDPYGKSRDLGDSQYLQGGLGMMEMEKNIFNEMGVIKSFGLINKAIEELDFGVAYFSKRWSIIEREHYRFFPVKVETIDTLPQIYGAPFKVTPMTDQSYLLEFQEKEFQVTDPVTQTTRKIENELNFSKVFKYGDPVEHNYFNFIVTKSDEQLEPGVFDDTDLYFRMYSIDDLTNYYMEELKVEQTDIQSSILQVETEGPVVEKEIKFLNKLSEKYIEDKLVKRNEIAFGKENFIRNQLNSIADSLANAENSLEKFKSRKKAVNLRQTATNALNKLQILETEKGQFDLNLKYYQSLLNYVSDESNLSKAIAPSVVGINDPFLNDNLLELRRLTAERTKMNFYKGQKSYDLKLLDQQIKTTTSSLQENIKNLIASSQMVLEENDKHISGIERDLRRLPRNEKALLKFERKSLLYGNLYNYLSQELAKTEIARADNIADAEVLDEARMIGNNPVAPNKKLILSLGLLLGLGLPFGWIILGKHENEVVSTKELLQSHSQIPVIGRIVHFEKSRKFFSNDISNWHAIESFRNVSACLQLMIKNPDENIIGLTSIVPGEGKTFCAINLAIHLASSGRKTILINADMRKPSVLEGEVEANVLGLSDYLSGDVNDVDAIIQTHPKIPELSYILTNIVEENPHRLLSDRRFEQLLKVIKTKYDYVIIDAPAVGIVSDYLLISKHVNQHLLVVRKNHTRMSHLADIDHLIKSADMKNVFFIFNDVTLDKTKYGSSYYNKYYEENKGNNLIVRHLPIHNINSNKN